MKHRYFVLFKPYNMLSQFVSPYPHRLLGEINFRFPEGTHAIGRLDEKSEGLLILTTDKSLTRRLLHPDKNHLRHYLVQVERLISDDTLETLRNGMSIEVKRKGPYTTMPCKVNRVEDLSGIPVVENIFTHYVPHDWLHFELIEGKNRQIRKMCKAVRHKCKRLIRTRIENLELGSLKAGEVKEYEQEEFFRLLNLQEE